MQPRTHLLLTALAAVGCANVHVDPHLDPPVVSERPETTHALVNPFGTDSDPAPAPEVRGPLFGKVLGADGKPMAYAELRARTIGADGDIDKVAVVEIAEDGSFALPDRIRGDVELEVVGVGHVPMWSDTVLDGTPQRVEIRLGAVAQSALLGGDAVVETRDGDIAELEVGADGRAHARFMSEEGEVAYQIGSLDMDELIAPPGAERYVYDSLGGLYAVTKPIDGWVEISIELDRLPNRSTTLALKFDDPRSTAAMGLQYGQILEQAERLIYEHSGTLEEAMPAAWRFLEAELAKTSDPGRAQTIALVYMGLGRWFEPSDLEGRSADVAEALLASLPASSSMWSLDPLAAHQAMQIAGPGRVPAGYLSALLEHSDPDVGGATALGQVWVAGLAADLPALQRAWNRLHRDFAGSQWTEMAEPLDPSRPLTPGKTLPSFTITDAEGRTAFDSDTVRGRTTVLDFWASWCGPCTDAMPELHALDRGWDAAGKNVEILSLSFDESAADVAWFRDSMWPMPWAHVYVPSAQQEQLGRELSLPGLPSLVVVDHHGTIVSAGPWATLSRLEDAVNRAEKR